MAKKNYQQIEGVWKPDISNEGSYIQMTFRGHNSKGTPSRITIKVPKWAMSGIVKDVVTIFTADAAVAYRSLELLKESAK
jgi:hypothetical protein